jgi:virginiamycin B lyase
MFVRKVLSSFAASVLAIMAIMFVEVARSASVATLQAAIKEYDVPTPKSQPHDPAAAPDGALWWTEQLANKIGRLDPKTGAIKEYPLKTAHSGPHGLTSDENGDIWFTANFAGYIGKLDAKTGGVTEYKIPDARAKDPHTPVFDQRGTLWFTVQDSNFVGRLDPKTGKFDLKEVPTPKALPYGIVISSKGVPWFCEFGSNKLASLDPKTMAITEHVLPEGARPRRLAITRDDIIYYSDYARGYLGRYDTRNNKQEEWPSPGGPASKPYGIAIRSDGMVWYSESGVEPNTLVRFDPKTHEFASEKIPSGGGVVRNMTVADNGNLYLACSGVNKVAVVTP